MSRVIYTETKDTADQEALRIAHQVRIVAAPEEGNSVSNLPGGVYGYTWFIDAARELAVVALTNISLEGLFGPFPLEVRDAVYAALQGLFTPGRAPAQAACRTPAEMTPQA